LARFFSSAFMLVASWPRTPSKCSRPLLRLLDSLPYSLASHASMIFIQNKALAAPPFLYFACGLIKDVGRASRDVSWCMYG
jgi:hypothetical protein